MDKLAAFILLIGLYVLNALAPGFLDWYIPALMSVAALIVLLIVLPRWAYRAISDFRAERRYRRYQEATQFCHCDLCGQRAARDARECPRCGSTALCPPAFIYAE